MSDDKTVVDISILSERLNAQTEVHLKYTEAFVRIIGLLDEIKQTSSSNLGIQQEHFRLLLEKHISVIEQVKALAEAAKVQSSHTQDLIEILQDTLKLNNTEAKEELREQFESVKKMIVKKDNDLTLLSAKILEASNVISTKLDVLKQQEENYNKSLEGIDAKIDHMTSTVKSLDKYNSGWQSTWKQWRSYLIVFLAIIGIAETLVQLGVLHLTWGGK